MKSWKTSLLASAMILSIAVPASAQFMPVALQGNSAQNNAIQYSTGGIGLEDRAEMKGAAGAFNVLLMFGQPTGQFVVIDSVTIRKGNAEVLQVTDAGPLLYMNLPSGTYTVDANYKGVTRSRTVHVARRSPDVMLRWPVALD
jgi:hypothetical protein